MLDSNMWTRQMNHVEYVRSCSSCNSSMKALNTLEYKDFMVLSRHDEQLQGEAVSKKSARKTRFTSRKYA